MKRFLLIFLLIVLPLQYSWAAAAAYCQHENEPTTHFGHHSHQHQAQQADEPDDKDKTAQVHHDCGVCQFAGQASFLTSLPEVAVVPDVFTATPLFVSYTSHIAEGPKRPDRRVVA